MDKLWKQNKHNFESSKNIACRVLDLGEFKPVICARTFSFHLQLLSYTSRLTVQTYLMMIVYLHAGRSGGDGGVHDDNDNSVDGGDIVDAANEGNDDN